MIAVPRLVRTIEMFHPDDPCVLFTNHERFEFTTDQLLAYMSGAAVALTQVFKGRARYPIVIARDAEGGAIACIQVDKMGYPKEIPDPLADWDAESDDQPR